MKKLLTVIAVNFMLLSSIIIGWEIVCQFAYLAVHGDLLFRSTASIHRQLFEIHPYLAGRPKAAVKVEKDSKIITTINDHTRWTGAEKDDKNLSGDEFAEIIARAIAEIFKSNKPDSNTGNTADVML